MNKNRFMLLVSATLIGLSTALCAKDYSGYEEIIIISYNQPVFSDRVSHRLDLSPYQRAQIRETATSANKELLTLSEAMKMNARIIQDTFLHHYNHREINTLTEKQGELYAKKIQVKLNARHKVIALLNEEQQNKIKFFRKLIES